jgi:type IV fimbrial biogenesis protein FimT
MDKGPLQISGFTIIELMIVLAIAAILAAIAAPSFTATIQDNRLATQVNELQASLGLARSEAIKLNNNVTICPSSDGASCIGNWQNGWIVFVDPDANGVVANVNDILRVHGAITGANTITFTQANVIYSGTGFPQANVISTFRVCDVRGPTNARAIIINNTGRPGLARDGIDADSIVEDGNGNNVVCP